MPSIINGISSGTFFIIVTMALIILIYVYIERRRRNTTIHPDNQQDVQLIRQRSHSSDDSHPDGLGRSDTCPICLTDASVLTAQTNCGHIFCGKCIISFWKFQANWMSGMRCPVCRQQVTVLLPCFTADERNNLNNPDRISVSRDIKDFNRRFSNLPRTYREYFQDIPVLIPYIIQHIFSVEGLLFAQRLRIIAIILAVFAYVASPLDLLPESILGFFGLFDDVLIIICGALHIIISFRQSLARA